MTSTPIDAVAPRTAAHAARTRTTDMRAVGEPNLWAFGGALAFGCAMIVGFLLLVFWNGVATFWPKPLVVVTQADGARVAGEPFRSETFRPGPELLATLDPAVRGAIAAAGGTATRTLYRTGNYDIYNEDFRWVSDFAVTGTATPPGLVFVERLEWGPFVGRIAGVAVDGQARPELAADRAALAVAHDTARARWRQIRHIERDLIGDINHRLERGRLALRRVALKNGKGTPEHTAAQARFAELEQALQADYARLAAEAQALKAEDALSRITLAEVGGAEKTINLSSVVRLYPANDLDLAGKLAVYASRWWEFVSDEPREANTEGGVLPAIFGTFVMTLLLVIVVAPFGVVTALYLREYARQGRLVSIVRISVNNLAGVPSIVYGVFGLGFFAYVLGGSIDGLFFPERLPNPTFGTGGILWASLTLALLTVPVVIVATEEALSAVPRSMREGSLACGASKWQTIRHIVLPRAMPGIMTGIILAMARGAGEVAPLMLVGVVKLAPELPLDGYFPFFHLERSFMHLGFHIFDVGFQSRNSEAGKPMVFVTTLLLIGLIFLMNISAIVIRNRLKRKFAGSQF
ncbi:phosphate transport system permease protein [Stella humosa]|uniref:Phosphate transport system permease protein PstA n=1 Tax=Stella humosa TaxID=94 RepID=A0A3N1LJ17_9PROT|nr:phosphate ABC transporter permease PstA [Stella humosa]ROP90838.1 phosphate transport system permease protein [Stella humosa]BBK34816.1 phosphate transport system permease protein PstA [Stella humosa]